MGVAEFRDYPVNGLPGAAADDHPAAPLQEVLRQPEAYASRAAGHDDGFHFSGEKP